MPVSAMFVATTGRICDKMGNAVRELSQITDDNKTDVLHALGFFYIFAPT